MKDSSDISKGPWLTTYTGKQLYFTRATVDDIDIRDIAHGLSNICRYCGQVRRFYSVAEHSVRMANFLWTPQLRLIALLHDASEAYTNDVHSNLKKLLPVYMDIEEYLTYVIYDKYGIRHYPLVNFDLDIVKHLDVQMRTPEVLSFFKTHDGWELDSKPWSENFFKTIHPWSPHKAERIYLKLFNKTWKEIHGNVEQKVPVGKPVSSAGSVDWAAT